MDKASYEVRIKQWISIIQEANTSGMSKSSFCEQSGISPRQFYYWQRKVRDYAIKTQQSVPLPADPHPDIRPMLQQDQPVLCELPIPTPPSSMNNEASAMETAFIPEVMIQYGQFRLLVGNTVSEKILSTVLSVLCHV